MRGNGDASPGDDFAESAAVVGVGVGNDDGVDLVEG